MKGSISQRVARPLWSSPPRKTIHFVGFRGEEYWSAVRVWGLPDFFHHGYDLRMQRDVADYDTVVFANGCETRGPQWHSYPDIIEPDVL